MVVSVDFFIVVAPLVKPGIHLPLASKAIRGFFFFGFCFCLFMGFFLFVCFFAGMPAKLS